METEKDRPALHTLIKVSIGMSLLLRLLLLTTWLQAQTINDAEYFFDSDPGVGNGIPMPAPAPAETVTFSASISTAGLAPGRHLLYVRTKASTGEWSLYEPREFFIQAPIGTGEYFIDTDPGVGNASPLNISTVDDFSFTTSITTPLLSDGTHYLYIRIKDETGAWSLYEPVAFVVNSALPIELSHFTAERNAEGFVDLKWTTSSEKDNDYFEVERWVKNDPRFTDNFISIAKVPGSGTSAVPRHYTYRDNLRLSGITYYRLKQVDLDGHFTYSRIVSVLPDGDAMNVILYPNPSSSSFTLDVHGNHVEHVQVEIIDTSGKQIEMYEQVTSTLTFGTHWSPGLYVLRLQNGDQVMVFKLAKAN